MKRAYAGKDLGLRILEWAARRASLAGKKFLRLDCMADNPRIRVYYEKAGFTHKGNIQHSKWKASLYEKKLSTKAFLVPVIRYGRKKDLVLIR